MNKIVLGKSTLPNLKNIKSKVGSMMNTNYKVRVDSEENQCTRNAQFRNGKKSP